MKSCATIFLLLLLLLPVSAHAQTDKVTQILGPPLISGIGLSDVFVDDGSFWLDLDHAPRAVKLAYVRGLLVGGYYVVDNNFYYPKKFSAQAMAIAMKLQLYIVALDINQIVDGLDTIYKDPKNKKITIPDAIHVINHRVNKTAPAKIEKILQYLRTGKTDVSLIKDIPFPYRKGPSIE